tara:strand:- start:8103 stop:8693 length:591 start_codon:yes stop_codon:yes gene_type:complete
MLKEIRNKRYLAKGKRSMVYLGEYKNKKVCIKEYKSGSNRLKIEADFLKLLNKYKIGPKFIYYDEVLVFEFIKCERIIDWIKENSKSKIRKILIKILNQCRILDKLKIDKKELTNPYKHILVKDNNVVMIDFERCRFVKNPKNVTQFCQFLISKKIYDILKDKGFNIDKNELIVLLKKYKLSYKENIYRKILKILR